MAPHPNRAPPWKFSGGIFRFGFWLAPALLVLPPVSLLLSRRGLGQAKTQIEVLERTRNGQKEDQNSSNSRGS
nr:MAG TPA: hypothetical protein [Caudoviricetes sp.]